MRHDEDRDGNRGKADLVLAVVRKRIESMDRANLGGDSWLRRNDVLRLLGGAE